MNIEYSTSFIYDSFGVRGGDNDNSGPKVTFGWWLSEAVDSVLTSPKVTFYHKDLWFLTDCLCTQQYIQGPSPYRGYSRLRSDEIRLLCIYPGKKSEPLVGHLETTHLPGHEGRNRSGLTYDALSYVWGEVHEQPGTIEIGDQEVNITQNLAHALTLLRLSTTPSYF